MPYDREKEIEDNLKLVTYVLNKYFYNTNEDLFQTGCLGLIKAVDNYNPNKKIKKSTYYAKCIYNAIACNFRHNNCQKRGSGVKELSLDNYMTEDLTYMDTLKSDDNIEEELIYNEDLTLMYQCYDKLNEKEKIILMYSFGLFGAEKKTQCEIGAILQMNQTGISRTLKRILLKMRRMMTDAK